MSLPPKRGVLPPKSLHWQISTACEVAVRSRLLPKTKNWHSIINQIYSKYDTMWYDISYFTTGISTNEMVFKSLTLKQTNKKKEPPGDSSPSRDFLFNPLNWEVTIPTPLSSGHVFTMFLSRLDSLGFGAKVGQPATRVGWLQNNVKTGNPLVSILYE